MNDETLAALERVVREMNYDASHYACTPNRAKRLRADAALIRALIERERAGGERAQIVAYLHRDGQEWTEVGGELVAALALINAARAIAAGAHVGGE